MGFVKREYTHRETVITAENLNAIQDAILALEDGLFSIDNDKSGEVITITDADKRGFRSLNIFGKTTQDGAPTPGAPVALVSIGNDGNLNLTVSRKNLVDVTKATPIGTERIEIKNNTIVIGAGSGLYGVRLGVVLEVGKTYTMSVGNVSQHDANFGFRIIYDDDTSSNTYGDNSLLTITVTKPIKDVCFYAGYGVSTTSQIVITQLQIEEGVTHTAYEPYQGQSLALSTPNGLRGIPVSSGGNYTDSNGQQWVCDTINFARRVFTKRIGLVVLNGLETWYRQETNKYFYMDIQDREMGSNLLCDSLAENPSLTDSSAVGWWARATDNSLRAVTGLENSGIAGTSCDLKTYLADNPITVQYILAEPIETPLTEEELTAYAALHTYKEHTTVSNDAGAYMELEYLMDAKKDLASNGGIPSRLSSITLLASAWKGSDSLYYQGVVIKGVTPYSKVDLLPSVEQLAIFHNKDVAFVTENEDGIVTVYAIGVKPTQDYTMQVQITEVAV